MGIEDRIAEIIFPKVQSEKTIDKVISEIHFQKPTSTIKQSED